MHSRLPGRSEIGVDLPVKRMTGCATTTSPAPSGGPSGPGSGTVITAASINAWGSLLSQLGGTHVQTSSIIANPDTDPHDYEPTPADGRTIANSALFVENGVGYDPWAAKALAANPNPQRVVIDVGQVVGVTEGVIRTGGIPLVMWERLPMRLRPV